MRPLSWTSLVLGLSSAMQLALGMMPCLTSFYTSMHASSALCTILPYSLFTLTHSAPSLIISSMSVLCLATPSLCAVLLVTLLSVRHVLQ
ncbi:hypothetical protein EDD21DRAFT_381049 [Dissophora ornata]|nr:hypothetical protein EDD21DRAFT_381049 [Dissophora ornata]